MKQIYFDNAATTPLCSEAKEAFDQATMTYGNPSSLHTKGLEAEKIVSVSEKTVLSAIKADGKSTLLFTGCGTESNNTALFGTAYAKKSNAGKRIIISDSEHPSVYECAKELGERGFDIKTVSTKNGRVNADELLSYVDGNTLLVSIMTVNNENGALYDIKDLCSKVKAVSDRIVFHTDATQAFMKTDISVKNSGVDMMTVSAHKIGGPKGVGALYIAEKLMRSHSVKPLLFGGGQENGMRSGTENTAGIASFAAAVSCGIKNYNENLKKISSLSQRIKEGLTGIGVRINEPEVYVPHIISATLPGIKSEVMLHFLSAKGIYISSGSACSSHHPGISRPMQAFGLSAQDADKTVRISIGAQNTEEEAECLLAAVQEGTVTLIKTRN